MNKRKTRTKTTRKIGKLDHYIINTNTKTMTRCEQVGISRSRAGYTRVTHDGQRTQPGMPLLRSKECKETKTKRLQMDITKEIWKGGKQEMEKLIM
jgi:hypothetical protein